MSQNDKVDIPYIDYTRLLTLILYEGGGSRVMELLRHKGLNEFLATYASTDALGKGGYLEERGLVVLADDKLKALQDALQNDKK